MGQLVFLILYHFYFTIPTPPFYSIIFTVNSDRCSNNIKFIYKSVFLYRHHVIMFVYIIFNHNYIFKIHLHVVFRE